MNTILSRMAQQPVRGWIPTALLGLLAPPALAGGHHKQVLVPVYAVSAPAYYAVPAAAPAYYAAPAAAPAYYTTSAASPAYYTTPAAAPAYYTAPAAAPSYYTSPAAAPTYYTAPAAASAPSYYYTRPAAAPAAAPPVAGAPAAASSPPPAGASLTDPDQRNDIERGLRATYDEYKAAGATQELLQSKIQRQARELFASRIGTTVDQLSESDRIDADRMAAAITGGTLLPAGTAGQGGTSTPSAAPTVMVVPAAPVYLYAPVQRHHGLFHKRGY